MAELDRPREAGFNAAAALFGRIAAATVVLLSASLLAQMLLAYAGGLSRETGEGLIALVTFVLAVTVLLCIGANRIHPASCVALSAILLVARVSADFHAAGDLTGTVGYAMILFAAYFLGSALAAWLSRTRWLRPALGAYAAALLILYILPPSARAIRAGTFAASAFAVIVPPEVREAWRLGDASLSACGLHFADLVLLAAAIVLAMERKIGPRALALGLVVAASAVGVLTALAESPVPASPWLVATVFAARAVRLSVLPVEPGPAAGGESPVGPPLP